MSDKPPHPWIALFEKSRRDGRIDLDSGAWGCDWNQRKANCGRCAAPIPKGKGQPYNKFMTDGYRATTKYLCPSCVTTLQAPGRAENARTAGLN